jgi:flavorubredoxin
VVQHEGPVVYESMFGNTEQIARAVAAGLEESVDVQVAEVTDARYRAGSRRGTDRGGRSTHTPSL